MKIGFIGLGRMGAGMAANLLKAGHEVTVYNRSPAKTAALAAQGAKVAVTIADACRGEAVLTMLANDQAVEDVVFGDGGVIETLSPGAIHISSSTISVVLAERLTLAHRELNSRLVSAPVFGRPEVAAAGQLAVVAAGPAAAIDDAGPILDAIGRATFIVSETPAHANLVKLSGNFLLASVIEALGEAMALVGKAGIDRTRYLDTITSALFDVPAYRLYGAMIAEGRFEPAGFAAPLGQKDIRLALAAAEGLNVPMPLASLLRDRFLTLMAQGGDQLDWSAIGGLAAADAGQPRRGRTNTSDAERT
ncbi:NAD(P)-dependent oxidoreductase [Phenylobacterium sp.]|jgi:3-hydroxyisobutyrate dehydrogenase-like beta-hydroxyacid dehydrogenase|uniref:NAD(P)-dependent oxidoreductase n=1 Tax=Phenylobacterium sp. TaxID=1871053 RepID=UPI002E35EDB7|nr:NAD(P)-dependent oxidoreductase [Phenylobacterium sp.]HEX3363622.1 NAD(P)-dependent oxidoreductase [Phenylobacterium sp.]